MKRVIELTVQVVVEEARASDHVTGNMGARCQDAGMLIQRHVMREGGKGDGIVAIKIDGCGFDTDGAWHVNGEWQEEPPYKAGETLPE